MRPNTNQAYQLMHDGALAFAHIERNGIMIDVPYCEAEMTSMQDDLDGIQEQLMQTELGKAWRRVAKKEGKKLSLQKKDQLRTALYDGLGMQTDRKTEKGGRPVDADTLREFERHVEGIDLLLQWEPLRTARNTFMK